MHVKCDWPENILGYELDDQFKLTALLSGGDGRIDDNGFSAFVADAIVLWIKLDFDTKI